MLRWLFSSSRFVCIGLLLVGGLLGQRLQIAAQVNLVDVALARALAMDDQRVFDLSFDYVQVAEQVADARDRANHDQFRLGLVHLLRQDLESAEAAFHLLPLDSMEYRMAYWLLGNVYLAQGLEDKGLAALKRAEATLLLKELGLQAFEAGDYPRAIRAWQSAEAVWARRGIINTKESAAAATVYNRLGLILTYEGDYDAAVRAYRSYLALYPDEAASVLWRLGDIYRVQGQYAEAEAWLQKARTQAPQAPDPYSHLGVLAADQGQWSEAAAWFQEALARDPEWPAAHIRLAKAYEALGELDLARVEYEAAVELEGEISHRLALAAVCERIGCVDVAIAQYRQVLAIEPDNRRAQERLEALSKP